MLSGGGGGGVGVVVVGGGVLPWISRTHSRS